MTFEEKVDEKMQAYVPYLQEIEGIKRPLLENTLRDYCHVDVQLDEIKRLVQEEGPTIINKQGNVVRNPNCMTQHQLMNEKNAMLPKILKYVENETKTQVDEFTEFLRG